MASSENDEENDLFAETSCIKQEVPISNNLLQASVYISTVAAFSHNVPYVLNDD